MSTATPSSGDETPGFDREALAARISPAAYLTTTERETYWRIDHDAEMAVITSAEKGLARRIVKHPKFDIHGVSVVLADGTVEYRTAPQTGAKEPIYRVEGKLPVGCLNISLAPRESTAHYEIVSDGVLG